MLSDETAASILYAVATGMVDQALDIVVASDELDDDARKTLRDSLTADEDASSQARRFGDGLRALKSPRHLVNECYRVSFYLGDAWRQFSRDPLFAYFSSHRAGKPLDKWPHYFPIYSRHLAMYRGSAARVLEIGVYRGGGLELLRHHLGDEAVIVGVDIDPNTVRAAGDGFVVEIGDQEDQGFLARVAEKHGPFDIVIDDGGHSMRQQIRTAETLFPLLAIGGTYLVEDCHTSYWPEYADPEDPHRTFIDWVKDRIDDLHAYHHSSQQDLPAPWATSLGGLHIYDSLVVMDKTQRFPPFCELSGTSDFINSARDAQAVAVGLVATRDAAVATREAAVAARDAAVHESGTLRSEVTRSELELATLRDELARTQRDLGRAQGIVEEMRGSTSWQVTAPLRRMVALFRR